MYSKHKTIYYNKTVLLEGLTALTSHRIFIKIYKYRSFAVTYFIFNLFHLPNVNLI